jgi:hypothetical protein
MARFDRKSQFLLGRVTNVRSDGSFDIRYDNGAEESRVDRALIVPVASDEANEAGEGSKKGGSSDKKMSGFDDLKERGLSSKEQQKQHFLELYAKREEMRQEEQSAQLEEEKAAGRVMGADCESQACGACKLVVDEFGEPPPLTFLALHCLAFLAFLVFLTLPCLAFLALHYSAFSFFALPCLPYLSCLALPCFAFLAFITLSSLFSVVDVDYFLFLCSSKSSQTHQQQGRANPGRSV